MKRKKKSVSKLKKECDTLISQIIKIRDKNICQRCRKTVSGSNCHASHVIPKSAGNRLRWDEQNLKVLCMHCHLHWWHKNPKEAWEWFLDKFPERAKFLDENKSIIQMKHNDFIYLRDCLKRELTVAE